MLTSQDYSITSCNELELVTHCTILDLLVTLGKTRLNLVIWFDGLFMRTVSRLHPVRVSVQRQPGSGTDLGYQGTAPVSPEKREAGVRACSDPLARRKALRLVTRCDFRSAPLTGNDRIIEAIGITSRAVALQGSTMKYKHEN
jgi:hypothetical protein